MHKLDPPITQKPADRRSFGAVNHRDLGTSFIEILVAIVLLGVAAVAVLAMLRTSVVASDVNEDHAVAHAWLQSLADELYVDAYVPCDTGFGASAVASQYGANLTSPAPIDWTNGSVSVTNVLFWGVNTTTGHFEWGPSCSSSAIFTPGYDLQLIEIEVTNLDSGFTKSVEVIRGA